MIGDTKILLKGCSYKGEHPKEGVKTRCLHLHVRIMGEHPKGGVKTRCLHLHEAPLSGAADAAERRGRGWSWQCCRRSAVLSSVMSRVSGSG